MFGEVHEAIVTRGDVQSSSEEIKKSIHTTENCVLVCSQRCHNIAQHTDAGKIACENYLRKWEGKKVNDFIERMQEQTSWIYEKRTPSLGKTM